MREYIQQKWAQGLLPGIDCILFGNGKVVVGNCFCLKDTETNEKKWYWFPLCDTTVQ